MNEQQQDVGEYKPKLYNTYSRCRHCWQLMFLDDADVLHCGCTEEDFES